MFKLSFGIPSFVTKAINSIKNAVHSQKPKYRIPEHIINKNQRQISIRRINSKQVSIKSTGQTLVLIDSKEKGRITALHTGCDRLPAGLEQEGPGQETPGETDRLDPATIPKFVSQLEKPPVYMPTIRNIEAKSDDGEWIEQRHIYTIDICEFKQQILPEGFPKTTVLGYGGLVRDAETGEVRYRQSSPGGTIEALRGVPVMVNWRNILNGRHPFAVDPTLHWANPNDMPMHPPMPWPPFPPGFPDAQFPVPSVTHLHGAEVSSLYDGHPDAWITSTGKKGPAYSEGMYFYPNTQEPATMWYHDHTSGMTRLSVYAGLAGFYLLRGTGGRSESGSQSETENCGCGEKPDLPEGRYEIPLVIQDRVFRKDGSLFFNEQGINPEIDPYWFPGMIGDTILVNGKAWPNLDIERRQYRFRLLNGSNDRFYHLKLSNGLKFTQIGSDGGYLPGPVELETLLIAPAERMDILIDFSCMEPGASAILLNDAPAPYPGGFPVDENTGRIMRFTVLKDWPVVRPRKLPCKLNDIVALRPDSPERVMVLTESTAPSGAPSAMYLNGQKWGAEVTETPVVGSTEDWVIVSMLGGAHPVHLHLIQFQVISRQEFKAKEYNAKWEEINGTPPLCHKPQTVPLEPYLIGEPIPPEANETGWKDTVKTFPDQVLRIRVRYAPTDIPVCDVRPGVNLFPFDPAEGPGYVWHCHILDHEDNEMMRPIVLGCGNHDHGGHELQ
ncbi:MAG TPA: multicopper oxidase [Anaerovoracaceae bacterium]|nr:multicopper oxidase [Anaerovoracaceae bacterium]